MHGGWWLMMLTRRSRGSTVLEAVMGGSKPGLAWEELHVCRMFACAASLLVAESGSESVTMVDMSCYSNVTFPTGHHSR
jgi:hypothetical protein